MARFDRYLLSQLMVLFGFFSLILVLIYWINRAVVLFDQLIADGQSFAVFLEFTALSLPSVIRLAAPLAAFAAAVYVTNRMTTESELVVVQATGYSSFRLARPVLFFGLIVVVLMSVLIHFLVPVSTSRLAERQYDIAQNATARLFTEGQFIEPAEGVSFYIREITAENELLDIFLSDTRDPTEHVIYTAKKAFLIRDAGETQLVMIDGLVQNLTTEDQRLVVTSFEDFAYNIGTLVGTKSRSRRRAAELGTWQLLRPTPEVVKETRNSAASLIARGHDRFSQSLLGAVAALLGFATLLVGSHSRFGVWRQIVAAIVLIVVVKGTESIGLNLARKDDSLWFAAYLPIVTGICIIWCLLFASSRPYLFKRRIKEADAT
ncbi:LPS export ABC transporter permease LptF [Yoonia sediminilitoris]|uniref:Lipopolysaccharide export system permease protein n=1 Tax=Yoonia sediminilitoris TaxID=1286148 RepID=A0A2T6KCY0_9RHOB|nr:LPS export ABC transporter permease LptF [Yoonia sediminilitoris]PUB12758.1 lipopolysaccharide export system permease protein [Yoonia sediminilitoris]RCW94237.1 lipopolysaccharide export system permease protein [Yoonia sediminilitoris]